MPAPDDRRYLKTHEWHKPEGDGPDAVVTLGLSRFAVDELTDITYLEITASSGHIARGDSFGEIESVKATSDLYSGIDGEVVEVNQEALDNPAIINDDPYEKGWMIKIRPTHRAQLDELLSAADYEREVGA